MRTILEIDIASVCPSLGTRKQSKFMPTTTRNLSPQNSHQSEDESVSSDYIFIPSSSLSSSVSLVCPSNTSSEENHDDIDYFSEYLCPSDSDDDSRYFNTDQNDDVYLENHLIQQRKFDFINHLQDKTYQRSKRSNKKMHAQRQIKSKHAKSIQIKSHNKHLYIHHRLAKKVLLDEPRYHCIPSSEPVPLYTFEELRSIIYQHRPIRQSKFHTQTFFDESPMNFSIYQYREYTLNEYNIPDEPSYDDTMVDFLLEMQNRDLSPEDYEMLLRLDERVQRKTLNTNILDTLPTIDVNETHLDEQCTICMEKYNLGQEIKLLPCQHIFHLNCIETYLKEFSIQCPLDNLPLI